MSWKLIHRSGETYKAEFSLLLKSDITQLKKKDGWSRGLDWSSYIESNNEFTVYKLHIYGNYTIQGLIAIAIREGFVEVDLIEKAPLNRRPRSEFINAAEVLFGLAAQLSFNNNGDGYVLLQAKTGLMEHYIDHYGMEIVNSRKRLLALPTIEAKRLIELYFD